MKIEFDLDLSDASFFSINCSSLFTLNFKRSGTAIIRSKLDDSGQIQTFTWAKNGEIVTLNDDIRELDLNYTQEYQRKGNNFDLVLNLSPGNSTALGLEEPFSCQFRSRTSLVD